MLSIKPNTKAAYQLLHDGALVLAEIERTGIRIDRAYCERQGQALDRRIARLTEHMMDDPDVKEWRRLEGAKFNLDSPVQLSRYLFTHKGLDPVKETAKGNASVDDEALGNLDVPFIKTLLAIRKLKKAKGTYLEGVMSGVSEDGLLHPFFNLHTVATFRSCVAKGSLVLAARDFSAKGVPIEDIREGDYVYCFDDNLAPAIKRVLWAGKTGHRQVIRLHWKGAKGIRGFLDVTPEHLIRHISGRYIQAQELTGDLRRESDSRHSAKIRVLSANRSEDELFFTGHSRKNGTGILEHRFLYSEFIGPLTDKEIVHHKDNNHFNHSLDNLEKMNSKEHGSIHVKHTLLTEESRKRNILGIRKAREEGRYTVRSGADCSNYLALTKMQCLRTLSKAGGLLTKVATDFVTFKNYLRLHGIDVGIVKLRYDKDGVYISRGRLLRLSVHGRPDVQKILGHNYYKLLRLYKLYRIDSRRRWGNQFGSFVPGNHQITRIEWRNVEEDVYDIEVEDSHNFIANEICVHNSSASPNFQNIPIRDPDVAKLIRRAFIPRLGHQLGGVDYAAIEVKISAAYHQDPVMLEYINNSEKDMHRDMAMECYLLEQSHVTKQIRYCAKNKFVFPQFYGDWYKSCARSLWDAIPAMKLVRTDGMSLKEHLHEQGIRSYQEFENHIRKVEDRFWNDRFRVYERWKDRWLKQYERSGKIHMLTGFTCSGVMQKNQVINYPVQGVAFHCLLWSLIRLHGWMKERGLRSRIVGQIHDEITMDNHAEEMGVVLRQARQIMCEDIRKEWKWIATPLEISAEFGGKDESWYLKKPYAIPL